jgi:hypothetical protein
VNPLRLTVIAGELAVWRLAADAPMPEVEHGALVSLTRTTDELSVVSASSQVPDGATVETGWRCLRVEGPLSFEMTGVLAELSVPLAAAAIPIFVISTFDTDYILVKATDLDRACSALRAEGNQISVETLER